VDTLDSYLEALASAAPTPGGGSAATIVVAAGAALVAMVARITRNNPRFAAHHALADDLILEADVLRTRALAARAADERAYGRVVSALALPKGSADEKTARSAEVQAALTGAAEAPLDAAEIAKLVAVLVDRALAFENTNLVSDLGSAAEFAAAALASAAINVRANHAFMKDRITIARQERELARYERDTAALVERTRFEVGRAFATA